MYRLRPRPDVACSCGLDGWIATRRGYPPVLVRSEKLEAVELSRYMRPQLIVNAIASEATGWLTRTLTWLLLRALPLKKRATVVDAVLMPTLSPPRSPIRARDEMCLFILGVCERTARCTCESAAAGKDLRGVCMCIDLVFSYSIDATNCLFNESDALRSRFFLPESFVIKGSNDFHLFPVEPRRPRPLVGRASLRTG